MTDNELAPGQWPTLSKSGYARLVRLAEARLVGYEAAAEDVVSGSLIKWTAIPEQKRGIARIEQVIKSESASWRRSEDRRQARERRYGSDPTVAGSPNAEVTADLGFMIGALELAASNNGINVERRDRAVLFRLLSGEPMSTIAEQLGEPRHRVRSSKKKWQLIWHLALHVDTESGLFGLPHRPSRCCHPTADAE